MIVSSGFSGLGAPVARRKTVIELDPLIIEGKIPAGASAGSAPAPGAPLSTKVAAWVDRIPWKWVAVAAGLGGLYLLAQHARKKGRRGPLGVLA